MAPKLWLVQAMWGMVGLPSRRQEWSVERKLELIAEAGFDAVDLDIPLVAGKESWWERALKKHGLGLGLQGPFIHGLDDLERCARTVIRMKAPYLDAQVGDAFMPEAAARRLLRTLVAAASKRKVSLRVQTHRGRVTQDLLRTVDLCRAVPRMRLNLDLSHYFVAGGFGAEPLAREAEEAFDLLLRRTSMIDARVSNGHQVQVDIGPEGESPYAAHFLRLWKRAMAYWLESAGPDDLFVFRSELGPPDYSILDLEGRELSDRWAQAKVMLKLGRRLWDEVIH